MFHKIYRKFKLNVSQMFSLFFLICFELVINFDQRKKNVLIKRRCDDENVQTERRPTRRWRIPQIPR